MAKAKEAVVHRVSPRIHPRDRTLICEMNPFLEGNCLDVTVGRQENALMRRVTVVLLAFVVAVASGCAGGKKHAVPSNVLLITMDTTRADHLGCYGHTSAMTPNLDWIAENGVLFEHAYTPVPITLPSHTSIMTGMYPPAHGVRDNGIFTAGDDLVTMAEVLSSAGWSTGAAVGAYPVVAKFGLSQGFQFFDDNVSARYQDLLGNVVFKKSGIFFDERRASAVNLAITPWIERHAKERFFVWVHYFDPHQPQEPPPPYDRLFASMPYDGEIAYTDSCIGALLDKLRELKVLSKTLVVVTADHGEGLGEHGEYTHSLLAYNATLHVPLLMMGPGLPKGVRVKQRVSTVDILPTVLDLVGVDPPEGVQGRSLLPLVRGEHVRCPPYYAETLSPKLMNGWGELRVLFWGKYKYIFGPEEELYDLDSDPKELSNLAGQMPDLAADLKGKLQAFLNSIASPSGPKQPGAPDPETVRQLIALGYLSPAGDEMVVVKEELDPSGISPKSRVRDVSAYSRTKSALSAGDYLRAHSLAASLLEHDPTNPRYLELEVQSLLMLGMVEKALKLMENADQKGINYDKGLVIMAASAQWSRGDRDSALKSMLRCMREAPSGRAAYILWAMFKELGNKSKALSYLREACKLDPELVPARLELLVEEAQSGNEEDALKGMLELVEKYPYDFRVLYNASVALIHMSRFRQARKLLERVVALEPGYARGRLALLACYQSLGNRQLALDQLRMLEAMRAPAEILDSARDIVGDGRRR